jgi:hypothetical protein
MTRASWDLVYSPAPCWAVQIVDGMRHVNLPEWFSPIFQPCNGGLAPLRFRSGRFFFVEWRQLHPLDWHTAFETPLGPGDWLLAKADGSCCAVLQYRPNVVPEADWIVQMNAVADFWRPA